MEIIAAKTNLKNQIGNLVNYTGLVRIRQSFLFLLLSMSTFSQAQDLERRLHDAHETYREKAFTHRRFKHPDIVPLLNALSSRYR